MRTQFIESLEPRTLLAGVTLLTHGRAGHLWGWIQTTANELTQRFGGPAQVPQYILTIAPADDGHLIAQKLAHVAGTGTPQASSGQIVFIVDYIGISTNPGYSLAYIGEVAADFMLNTPVDGIRLAELPIHEIAQSRGTGLCDEIAKSLGKAGVWVDQETYLDPAPLGVMGDAMPVIYDNVAFVDNYWRTDGNPNNDDTDGRPVDGAYNLNVQWLQDHHDGYFFAHLTVPGYYIGTMDFSSHDSGEGPIHDYWYGNTPDFPARDQTGFLYTSDAGGERPLSGVWAASGGSGQRTPTGQQGQQWPNITDLSVTGGKNFTSGQTIGVSYIHQDRDDDSSVTFSLDRDQNPYNNNFVSTLGQKNLTASGAITSDNATFSLNGVTPGTYWIGAKISDGQGHWRFAYSKSIVITAPPPPPPPPTPTPPPTAHARLDANHILRVVGTDGDDVIKIYQSSSTPNRLIANVNGLTAKFVLSNVQRIYVYGQAGNDSLSIVEKYGAIFNSARLMGDAGNDTLVGGSGNDLLFGGDGNDRLYGGKGNDRLYGEGGTDRLYGQVGKDAFVNSKRIELMDFAKGDSLVDLV